MIFLNFEWILIRKLGADKQTEGVIIFQHYWKDLKLCISKKSRKNIFINVSEGSKELETAYCNN